MKLKRLVSAVLAVGMALTMLPASAVTAFAEDADPEKGTLLVVDDYQIHTIDQPGTYQMKGDYNAPIYVKAEGEVTINITGDVNYVGLKMTSGSMKGYGSSNYAIFAMNSNGNVTINNQDNYTFTAKGENQSRGVLYVDKTNDGGAGHAVVNGGIYDGGGDDPLLSDKETFFNRISTGTLILNNVQIEAVEAINNRGILEINGSVLKGGYVDPQGGINPVILNKMGGSVTITNTELYSEKSCCIYNVAQSTGYSNSTVTMDGSTIVKSNSGYPAIFNNDTLYVNNGTITASNSDAIQTGTSAVLTEITGGSIENSKRGIRMRGGDVILKNADFKNNGTDIYLEADKQITIDESFKGTLTVNCADMSENRQITTNGDNQKDFKLISTNNEYIVIVHKNDDGTEYQELVKHIGSFVTAKNAVATAEISGEVKTLDDTVQVPENTEVTVKAEKAPEGMVFEKWEVSPADAITDEAFDLKAETATFKMPACDVTVTAKYAAKEEPVKPEPKPEEPETKLYDLTVKNAEVTIVDADGKAVETTKNEDGTLTAKVPEKAAVTVKYTAPTDAIVFDLWSITSDAKLDVNVKENPLTFTMPDKAVTIEAMTRDATIESDGPGVLGTAAMIGVGVAGTAVLGYQSYMIGTELYLDYVLPAGAAIPQNYGELALLLWTDAGQPAPAAVLATDATDEQKALTWAVENQLISADKAADASVGRWEVIDAWNKAQEMKH